MSAPLHHHIADAPADGRAFWVSTRDGVRIRFAVWDGPKDYVLIFPGRTEYVEKYGRIIQKLRERALGCVIIDWRNQGLSDRAAKTGHVVEYEEYQRDLEAVLSAPQLKHIAGNFHLLSHSMGGLIALRSLQNGIDVRSCVFSAPMWGMGLAPPVRGLLKHVSGLATKSGFGKIKVLGSKRGSYIKEADPQNNSLMSDPESAKWVQNQLHTHPELALGGPSWAWLNASHKEIGALSDFAVPNLPTLTLLGDRETVVNPNAITERIKTPENGALLLCEGAKHEVLMETPEIQGPVWEALDALWAKSSHPMS